MPVPRGTYRGVAHPIRTLARPLPISLVHVTSGERGANFRTARPQHSHSDLWHLVLTTSGRGTFVVNGTVATANAPSLFLIGPGIEHSFGGATGDTHIYSEVTFQIPVADAKVRSGWTGLLSSRFGPCRPAPAFAHIPSELSARLSSAIDELVQAAANRHPELAVIAQGWIDHMLFLVRQHLVGTVSIGPLNRLRDALHDGSDLDLTDCARIAGLSPQHLCRAFSRRFGMPPLRYRRRAALLRAANQLRADDQPISAIAAAAGFADHRYFIRAFGAEFGMPPAAYRRWHRQLISTGI
ncbi:MAG: AraC family transcriptional regulator [Planctomycetota bacterium]|mgnify:CR=1 FL=1